MDSNVYKILSALIGVVRIFVIALILLSLWAFFGQIFPHLVQAPEVRSVLEFGQKFTYPLDSLIHAIVPRIKNFDLINLIKIILFTILLRALDYYLNQCRNHMRYVDQKLKFDKWRSQGKVATNNSLYIELERKLDQINKARDEKEINKLSHEFMELKRLLESKSRYLAFLSMDVVDSTGMKAGEDKSVVQLDFLRFKKNIQKILDSNKCVKSCWTPDGVMACFNSVDEAVIAAQSSLKDLNRFNKEEKQISRDFAIRCGIHAGVIYYEEDLPLEVISDQVIDIAGHMQKHAEPGTIAISKMSIKPVDNTVGFQSTGQMVDQLEVCNWKMGT